MYLLHVRPGQGLHIVGGRAVSYTHLDVYKRQGQKGSTVASIVNTLHQYGAMDYTIVVAATAGDPAALQYYAPFAGAAIGEYFRDTGRHALVVDVYKRQE